jgi:hypothetical protein
MPTPSNIKTPPVEEPPIVVAPPSGFFNVIRPPPPSFPREPTPQWVAVELPPPLMSQIMEQLESGNKIAVTMTPEMFKDIWEMTHPGPWTSPSPTSHPPIEHGPVKGPENPSGKLVSVPVLPPGKEHGPVGGGESTTPPRERLVSNPPPIHHGPIRVPIPPFPPGPPVGPIGVPLPPGAANEWEEMIKREIEHRGPPIWLPMMGGSLAPAPGVPAVAPGTNQQGLAIKLP